MSVIWNPPDHDDQDDEQPDPFPVLWPFTTRQAISLLIAALFLLAYACITRI